MQVAEMYVQPQLQINSDSNAERIWRRLREEEDKFRAVFFKGLEIAVILRLADCRYLEVNDAACTAFGFRREEVIGRTPAELNVLADPDQFAKMLESLKRDGEIKNVELLAKRRDGQLLRVLLSAAVLTIGDERCCLVTARDISALRRAEEERASATSLSSEILALVSHEFRTPLNLLLGSFELAVDLNAAGNTAEAADLLRVASRAARRLADTFTHIIDLVRIDTGNFDCRPELVNVRKIVDSVLDAFSEPAAAKSLRLTVSDAAPEATMLFDPDCLYKALYNLVDNAVKFTPQGEVEVRLYRTPDGQSCLAVRDSGFGIDPSFLPRIFEPFSQATAGSNRRHQGCGLGLTLTKRYVDMNHATLVVASAPGGGAVFAIQQANSR